MLPWRLWDSGVRCASDNIAIDRAMLSWRAQGRIPNMLRFMQFDPPAVLVGFHQAVAQEVRLDYCRERGIDINRRVTGGGAVYFDRSQLGWEIVFDRHDIAPGPGLAATSAKILRGFVRGLRLLGVNAAPRGRNDVEVDGRKIAGTGATGHDDAVLFQGTLLVDFDVASMLRALRVPVDKLKAKELSHARQRVICLREVLGEVPTLSHIKSCLARGFAQELGIELQAGAGDLDADLHGELEQLRDETRSQQWLHQVRAPAANMPLIVGEAKAAGGKVAAYLKVALDRELLEEALFVGDFFTGSPHAIYDLEAALRRIPLRDVPGTIRAHVEHHASQLGGVAAAPFERAFHDALRRLRSLRYGLSIEEANAVMSIGKSLVDIDAVDHVLIPYCSKKMSCHYRYDKDCSCCGECEVGDIYAMARQSGTGVETIVNFEDLMATLRRLREAGARAYLGSCCRPFYLKHVDELGAIGLPGILVDMMHETCFDLRLEADAYAGRFERKVPLDIRLLSKLMRMKCGAHSEAASLGAQPTAEVSA